MIKLAEGMYSSLLQMKLELFRLKTPKKGRAIVEVDTDRAYVMSGSPVEESNKVRMFDKFIPDLRKMLAKSAGK